ncbi:CRISPR-associated endonuclease Cas2 [Aromatoleum sp.]|uniref:CRISPR-associated endonuclease Cas2 n=1 Tax=Aromatoleum sp. TaxID=2307007 RepID=UPI002FC841F1
MMVLVSYDVSTTSASGAKRLRHLAKACRDFGQRVQYSVFEIEVDLAQWTFLKSKLCELIDPEEDSLRFYYLGRNWQNKVEHIGAKPAVNLNGPLIL